MNSRTHDALDANAKALELNPNDSLSRLGKGETLGSLGDIDAAVLAFDSALEINEASGRALWFRSTVLNTLGRYNNALKDPERLIELWGDTDSSETPSRMDLTCAVTLIACSDWDTGFSLQRRLFVIFLIPIILMS